MTTNHPFTPSVLSIGNCAKCKRLESLHGTSVPCEVCNKPDTLTEVNGTWFCADCLSKELEAASTPKSANQENPLIKMDEISRDQRPTDLEHSAINKLGSQSIQSSEDYFNAETVAMATRWTEILADESIPQEEKHYRHAIEVREHFIHMKSVIFEAVKIQLEGASRQRANQVRLNELAKSIRQEEREKLHLSNIDYAPPVIKNVVKAPKVHKDDKLAAEYAKIMGISIEQAKHLIDSKFKEVTGFTCTCESTPGICKVHPK